MQADRLSSGQHPHHHHQQHQHQSAEQSANRSVTTITFPPVGEQVQSSAGGSASAVGSSSRTSRDRPSSSAFLLTTLVHCVIYYIRRVACGRRHLSVSVCVTARPSAACMSAACHDCMRIALVSAVMVMRCIHCSLVWLLLLSHRPHLHCRAPYGSWYW